MGDKYSAAGQFAVSATPGDTVLKMHQPAATSGVRARLLDFTVGVGGTPADEAIEWLIRHATTAGTEGAGVVPDPLDDGAPDPGRIDAGEAYAVEPTYTRIFRHFILNMRATYRWVAPDPLSTFVLPNANNAGIGATPIHATVVQLAYADFIWEE